MPVPVTTRSLEEIRQQLLSDALDQVQRLQDPTLALTKRVLADTAMAICDRDMAIRLLQSVAIPWAHRDLRHISQAHLTPTQPTSSQTNQAQPISPTPIKPNPSQPHLQSVTNSIGTT